MAAPPRYPQGSSKRPAPSSGTQVDGTPDEKIGDFRRGKEIGKGSFAAVYLVQHKTKKSYAAVKAVQMSKLSAKLKANLECEIDILKNIQHPHIVALFECIETPSWYYMIMEYCQLSDLSQFMKKRHNLPNLPETADIFKKYPNPQVGGLNEVLARHFVKQISSALQYLRGFNLIHRDIKPQNLLLNPAPSYMARQRPEDVPLAASEHSLVPSVGVNSLPMLKIADFGFARHLPSTSMAETLCGSPLYMAPEILRYERYDARADLWSTGAVLHEMVVGKPPFRANNHMELLAKIEKAKDVIPFDRSLSITRDMKNLIRKLLKKSPLDRASHEELFIDPVITGDIPGLAPEDKPLAKLTPVPDPGVSELSKRMAKQVVSAPDQEESRTPPEARSKARDPLEEASSRSSKRPSDQETRPRRSDDLVRRKSSAAGATEVGPRDVPTRSQNPREQRRPSIVAHATAPGRQELVIPQSLPSSAPRVERRSSRSSPLAGPPMIREHSSPESGNARADRVKQEKAAQDVAFEKEYVVIEKRAVEVNAFADELDANHNRSNPQHPGAIVRRATTQGKPGSAVGAQPASPSRTMQIMTGRPHQRTGSFERRYAPSPSATNMLTKALNAANVRIFGALGQSPPFSSSSSGPSPPRGYSAFPAYPAPKAGLALGDGNESKGPIDEDTRIAKIMEEAAHRSDVVYGFAEVKYHQLLPATPSASDGLGIQRIGNVASNPEVDDASEEDKDMTNVAIVGVSEEALVLYVKTLSILAKTIDLAGYWWSKQNRGEIVGSEGSSPKSGSTDVGKRVNNVVQWARGRFNECLEKSEVVGRRLLDAQLRLPEDHPGHPKNHATSSIGPASAIATSTDQIRIISGTTAEKLMFDRAIEMSKAAALEELTNRNLANCELGYVTAIMMLEAVLENDDEPLVRKPSAKKDKPADEVVNGMETEDRQTVVKLIRGSKERLVHLRRKLANPAPAMRRSGSNNSSQTTPKPASHASPAATPAIAGTPPR
ncbi:kinase-like protein [Polychaeton citri CBS 116435]|uniref:non-specific serine/threonine protein kinase n=1 Tax=Polychaeton citri CBS 116435 TaxID=1314669 RepID=A0A9P4QIF0_9PEZI|nr:kinase-like protein [Polychaeton citri CBS 116435]